MMGLVKPNKIKLNKIFVVLALVTQTACSIFGVRKEETPLYNVIESEGSKEIRDYSAYITAKTVVKGDYKNAQRQGFKILASYIFGANERQQSLSMTAPVVQENSSQAEKIAMTAPVFQTAEKDSWVIAFMMPSKYKLSDLPRPLDKRVQLEEVPSKLIASIRFTGSRGIQKNLQKAQELQKWLETKNSYVILKGPSSAGYDPPWTLPFFRRNEVHYELSFQEKSQIKKD